MDEEPYLGSSGRKEHNNTGLSSQPSNLQLVALTSKFLAALRNFAAL